MGGGGVPFPLVLLQSQGDWLGINRAPLRMPVFLDFWPVTHSRCETFTAIRKCFACENVNASFHRCIETDKGEGEAAADLVFKKIT